MRKTKPWEWTFVQL